MFLSPNNFFCTILLPPSQPPLTFAAYHLISHSKVKGFPIPPLGLTHSLALARSVSLYYYYFLLCQRIYFIGIGIVFCFHQRFASVKVSVLIILILTQTHACTHAHKDMRAHCAQFNISNGMNSAQRADDTNTHTYSR